MDKSITFKLPSELHAKLAQEAELEHRTISQQLRLILERHYTTHRVITLGEAVQEEVLARKAQWAIEDNQSPTTEP